MDLRLASTYVPALICAAKSAVVAMLARLLVPTGGASVLALSVAIDRRLMFMLPSAPPRPAIPVGVRRCSAPTRTWPCSTTR